MFAFVKIHKQKTKVAAHRNRVKASFRNDAANKIPEELRLKWQSANCNAYYLRIKWGISTVDLGQILSAFFISPYDRFFFAFHWLSAINSIWGSELHLVPVFPHSEFHFVDL